MRGIVQINSPWGYFVNIPVSNFFEINYRKDARNNLYVWYRTSNLVNDISLAGPLKDIKECLKFIDKLQEIFLRATLESLVICLDIDDTMNIVESIKQLPVCISMQ